MKDMITTVWNKTRSFVLYNFMLFCNLIVLVYLGADLAHPSFVFRAVLFLPCFLVTGVAAYLLNDFFDQEKDRASGKSNIAHQAKPLSILGLSLFLFATGLGYAYYLSVNTFYVLLVQFFVLLIYSAPPLRIKERGFIGVIADALYAHGTPVLVLLVLLSEEKSMDWISAALLLLFTLSLGIRDILLHQLNDRLNDIKSNTDTFARRQNELSRSLSRYAEYISAIAICMLMIRMYVVNGEPAFMLLAAALLVTYLVSYFTKNKPDDVLMRVYMICSSICFAFLLLQHKHYLMLLLLAHPYFISFIGQWLNKIYLLVKWVIKIVLGNLLVRYIPLFVNHLLFYLFLLLGRNLKEKPLYEKETMLLRWLKGVFQ